MFAFHFFAAVMHVPRLRTSQLPPTPISLTCDGHLEPRSVLGCVHIFLCTQLHTACSGTPTEPWLSGTPQNFLFFWVEPLVSASAGATPPLYTGSFVDFKVGIPESTGDMKLIFFCFDLLTHLALLLCFRYFLERWHLFGGCQIPWRPPVVLNFSPTTTPILSTPGSIFRTLVLFLAAKFPFLELHHCGPVLRVV